MMASGRLMAAEPWADGSHWAGQGHSSGCHQWTEDEK
jgi:hypothetical protein